METQSTVFITVILCFLLRHGCFVGIQENPDIIKTFSAIEGEETVTTSQVTSEMDKKHEELLLIVKDKGVEAIRQDDCGLAIYLTVLNIGRIPYDLFVTQEKCCEKINKREDCESIHLIGGHMGNIFPGTTKTMTLLYPTTYLHDRKGNCRIRIFSSDGGQLTEDIEFNTYIPRGSLSQLPRFFKNYLKFVEIYDCKSDDEDPLDECHPVDCVNKYSGYRNFFDENSRLCEKVPECISKSEGNHPDIAYVPISNTCRRLANELTEKDTKQMETGIPGPTLKRYSGLPLNIRCHKGVMEANGWCRCEKGWKSAEINHVDFNPNVMVYHMCTIWTGEEHRSDIHRPETSSKLDVYILVGLAGLLCLVIISLGTVFFVQNRKMKEETYLQQCFKEDEQQDSSSTEE
ncbi:uncharacterized protein LOC143228183 isoform X1 [Tachypleus tridentatus]|uniref:uncharacterized protein LOC143228183 isoform X1 n=1 Tax=Tachypleus tridentatus TaxID=6853 RepID=UPI003FD58CC4